MSIPVGDPDKFIILRSPITKCTIHSTKSYLYGFRDETSKLYLGLCLFTFPYISLDLYTLHCAFVYIYLGEGDKLLNAIRWYTLISFKPDQDQLSVYHNFSRRYHITERLLSCIVKSIIVDGTSIPRYLKILSGQYASWARDNWLNVHPQDELDIREIDKECTKFFQSETFSAALKEFLLGYISEENQKVEDEINKTMQTDYYADAAHSTIKHTMKDNICLVLYT